MFSLAEFVVEQLIRNSLHELQDEDVLADTIEDVYGNFLDNLLSTKFGQQQLDDFVLFLQRSQISVVSAFPDSATTSVPQISINLQNDIEAEDLATLCDFPDEEDEEIVPATIVPTFTATDYNSNSGIISAPDSVDLSNVRYNRWYVDGDGNEYRVFSPVSDETGDKKFAIKKGLESINLVDGKILSAIDRRIFQTNTIPYRETLLIGIHSQNSLLTKLLYHMVKYLIFKNKTTLEGYNIKITTLQGSDFNQSSQFLPDHIYARFLTMSFISYNQFRTKEIPVVDGTEVTVFIDKDTADREDNDDQTVQTK